VEIPPESLFKNREECWGEHMSQGREEVRKEGGGTRILIQSVCIHVNFTTWEKTPRGRNTGKKRQNYTRENPPTGRIVEGFREEFL